MIRGLSYIENFISPEEEVSLIKEIENNEWQDSLKRRVQHYGYVYDYTRKSASVRAEPIPASFSFLKEKIKPYFNDDPDQVIINEYEIGQKINPHIDAPSSFGDTVVSISLLHSAEMVFSNFSSSNKIVLQPRSALVMKEDARYKWKHSLAPQKNGKRISITWRKVIM